VPTSAAPTCGRSGPRPAPAPSLSPQSCPSWPCAWASSRRATPYRPSRRACASSRPSSVVLLILDDLQWADSASLDLLTHLARGRRRARLLILGAYREGEAAANPALERALTELTRLRALTAIPLRPLAEPETRALAAGLLGAPLDLAAGRLLHAQSEGNPFFAEELLADWRERGALDCDAKGWRLAGRSADALPPSITGAVRQRLGRLSFETLDLLRTAAIIGRTFESGLLAEVAARDAEAVEERLAEAVRARLLRAEPAGAFTFGHDKIRECLYLEVSASRRMRLHGYIGQALLARAGPEDAQTLAALAFHFARSGDRERGVAYGERAADRALAGSAPREAVAHYQTALDLLAGEGAPAGGRRGSLRLRLGEAALLAGAERDAVAAYRAARDDFAAAGDPAAAARAGLGLGRAHWRLEELAPARAAFEEALANAGATPDPTAVALLVDLATLLGVSLGQPGPALANAERALELARRLGDRRLEATATRAVGNLRVRLTDPAGPELLERALALAEAAGDPVEAAECCAALASTYRWTGEIRRSHAVSLRRVEFAERSRDPYQLRHIYGWLAMTFVIQGKWREADAQIGRARPVVEHLASPEPLALLQMIEGLLAYQRGDHGVAVDQLEMAMDSLRRIDPNLLVWYLGTLGVAQIALGKPAAARATLEEIERLAGDEVAGRPVAQSDVLSIMFRGLIAKGLGDRERVARYYARRLPSPGVALIFLVGHVLGELATELGEWAAAEAYLASAEATARREEIRPELGRILVAQAELALARDGRGGPETARPLLERALALFVDLEMAGEAEAVRTRQSALAGRVPPVAPASLPAGLSPREAEVLRLVAAGRSNREIAAALVVAERTVANHVASILNKTGSENRAAAAAFAIRHGLA
jgi:DNA-binding CsgD family transcriptional regulator/tetratricopeptide (TPR) repeat protein